MEPCFLESSAAVKLYIPERGTFWLQQALGPPHARDVVIVRIAAVEIAAAIVRRARSGAFTQAQAVSAIQLLRLDLQRTFEVIEVTDGLAEDAIQVALRYRLRGYDCVQLAAALRLQRRRLSAGLDPIILVSADLELNAAAQAEGLRVEDPNSHS